MQCPKCKSPMEKVGYQSIEIDRCTQCKGLWLDMGEREELKALRGSETLDTGEAVMGRAYNVTGKINCPECQTPMLRMVDNAQPHIWFESCSVCYGVFFDAGEFRDYKEQTVIDFFKTLAAKERK